MSVGHLRVFLAEMSVHVFHLFFNWIICSLGVEFEKYSIDLGYQSFSIVSFANIFSHSVGCLLVFLTVPFAVQKLFILMKSHMFILFFVSLAFGDVCFFVF